MHSDDLARPSFVPFDIEAEYVWIDCDLPKYEGFKVEVRMNLRNKERKRMNTVLDEIGTERDRITENVRKESVALDDRIAAATESKDDTEISAANEAKFAFLERIADAFDSNITRIHTVIAPYVRAWNVMDRDGQGVLIDAPAPMTAGAEAFDAIDQQMTWWLVRTIQQAYRGGKGLSSLSKTPNEQGELQPVLTETTPNDAPAESQNVNDQPSAANSRSRSRSTSKG